MARKKTGPPTVNELLDANSINESIFDRDNTGPQTITSLIESGVKSISDAFIDLDALSLGKQTLENEHTVTTIDPLTTDVSGNIVARISTVICIDGQSLGYSGVCVINTKNKSQIQAKLDKFGVKIPERIALADITINSISASVTISSYVVNVRPGTRQMDMCLYFFRSKRRFISKPSAKEFCDSIEGPGSNLTSNEANSIAKGITYNFNKKLAIASHSNITRFFIHSKDEISINRQHLQR